MPFLRMITNVPESKIPPDFNDHMTEILQTILNKPKEYCQVQIIPEQILTFGGSHEPCALLFLMSVGRLGALENKLYSEIIMAELESCLGILPHLTYINFVDPKPSDISFNIYD
ncbi:unnamed protein product [Brachionus calyciflorus]|uniref:L-dopachrome isomerase n=1 Tax=Brachionus calyciflorus TaxID=104777 RepID=A0A813QUF2_9BILA|nr:unnamed protein product [Brachionus calyciflorus]